MPKSQRTVRTPDRDRVAARAYELYCARGCVDGCDVDDWLEAERQLTEELRDLPPAARGAGGDGDSEIGEAVAAEG